MENEIKISNAKSTIGGICSIIVGIINILLVLYIIAIPAEQRFAPGGFYETYTQNPLPSIVAWIMISITAVLSFAAILPAVNKKFKISSEWFQIVSILGMVGYVVMALKFITLLGTAPELSATYLSGDEMTKKALVAQGLPQLDPYELLAMVLPGIWFITVNIIAFRKKVWSKIIAIFGILIGVCYIFVTPATIFKIELLDMITAGIGAIAAPVWFISMGVLLLKE